MPSNNKLSVKMKTAKLHEIELTEYEYELLLNNFIIKQLFGDLLGAARKRKGNYFLSVSLSQLSELCGFVAAEANHSQSKRLQDNFNELCDYLEGIEYEIKRTDNKSLH